MHISQPAASQALGKLRQIYGCELMVRQGNGIAATPEGEIVGRRCRRALAHVRALAGHLAARSHMARGLAADRLESHTTIAHLRALAAIADAGSLAAAAGLLGQTEASVQRAARELERLGGAPFFAGSPRAVGLTPEGREVSARASLALSELDRIHEELRERAGRFDGRLVIGALPLVRTSILPAAVVELTRRHPGARVEIVDGSYEHLVHRLSVGRVDLMVGALRADEAGLTGAPLFEDRLSVVARAGHPLAGQKPSLATLARYPWVLSRTGAPARIVFDGFLGAHLVPETHGSVVTGSLVALRGILLGSDALALLSPHQIRYEIDAGLLVTIGDPVPGSERQIGVTTRADWAPTRLQGVFLECLRAAASAEAGDTRLAETG